MKIYARIQAGSLIEIIQPVIDDAGEQIPVEQIYAPELVETMIDISELNPAPEVGYSYANGVFTAPVVEKLVPAFVSATQGGIALIQSGQMDAVQAAANDPQTPAEVKWAFDRAQVWERTSSALSYLSKKAGITDSQMDDLFIAAAQIQA